MIFWGLLCAFIGLIVGYFLFGNYMGIQISVKTLFFGLSLEGDGLITKFVNLVARGVIDELILTEIRKKILLSGLFSGIIGFILGSLTHKKAESITY